MRNLPERHRAMRSVFDGSWCWLNEYERQVFCNLSVFQGGFTAEAAEQVAGANMHILATLVDKTLLRSISKPDRGVRYDMHELVRAYAGQRLEESDWETSTAVKEAHLNYFLEFAERAEQFWDTAYEIEWLQLLRAERDNIHTALQWALDNQRVEQALRMNAALMTFWIYTSPVKEGHDWIEGSLAMNWDSIPDDRLTITMRARAKALNVAGYAILRSSEFERAISRFQEGLALYSALNDRRGIAWSLRGCGFVALIQGNLAQAQSYIDRSLAICQEIDDEWGLAWSIYDKGNTALACEDLTNAHQYLTDSLGRFRRQGNLFGEYRALISLGHALRATKKWTQAGDAYRQALEIQSRTLFIQFTAQTLEGIAHCYIAQGDYLAGVQLFGAAQARRGKVEMARWAHHEPDYQSSLALTRRQLPGNCWKEAWEAGDAMSQRQAVALALAE
jgi:tetratricopeptide (TPR) repeat protein